MVVSGGAVTERKNDEPQWYVLKTKTIVTLEWGRKVMWPIKCCSQEACRVLTGSPACYRPLSWKSCKFFKNYRDTVEAAALKSNQHEADKTIKMHIKKWKRARSLLLQITMGEHTMVVENTTRHCCIEATCANIDFVIKQLKSAE